MRKMSVLLAAIMLLSLLTGCGGTETKEPAQEAAISFTDLAGREISLSKPAERIVALAASDCEILYAIGAQDTLVGRGEYCNYPEDVLSVTAVGSGGETNIEQIIALQPDVLLMNDMDQTEEQVSQLEKAGIKVVMSDDSDIAEVYTCIEMIGALTGKEENAAAVIDGMKDTFAEIQENSTGDGSETVYFEVSPIQWGLWTAGTGTFMNEIAEMLGVRNCFHDVEGWAEISEEQVIARDPDYIVTVTMYYGEGPTPTEEILSRGGWENVTAVKNGKVLHLGNDELSRPAPRLAEGAKMLYEFIYES